jgi:hypothetical protein
MLSTLLKSHFLPGGGPLGPPVQDCPRECGNGRLYLKHIASTGKFAISCSNWPNCNKSIWLPACTKEAAVLDTPQSRCTSPACGPGAPSFRLLGAPRCWPSPTSAHVGADPQRRSVTRDKGYVIKLMRSVGNVRISTRVCDGVGAVPHAPSEMPRR